MNFIRSIAIFAIASFLCATASAQERTYPERPVRIVVPFPPAGAPDALARMLAHHVNQKHGWNLVVDNKPGAGGNLALDIASKAAPDGYTFVMAQTDNVVLNPLVYSKLPYDPDRDLEPIGLIAKGTLVLVVPSASPFKDVKQIVDTARSNPNKLTFASPGYGTSIHIVHQLLQRATGTQLTHVPYRGSALALPDLMSGRVDMYMGSIPTLQAQIESGALRALAVTSSARSELLKNVPTFNESGVGGVEMASAFGLMTPKGTPAHIIEKWNAAINDMLRSENTRSQILRMGAEPLGGSPRDMGQLYAHDRQRLGDVIRQAEIKLD